MNPNAVIAAEQDPMEGVRQKINACMQCGVCSGSCPNAFAMDVSPRTLWRMALMGMEEEIFGSKTFSLCSACYYCTLRCPRGLPLTEVMGNLKQAAAKRGIKKHKDSVLFYQSFMDSVRKNRRVDEVEFMSAYFLSMKNPLIPLNFTPLGMKLLSKGKLHPGIPFLKKGKKRSLEAIFKKAHEMENPK